MGVRWEQLAAEGRGVFGRLRRWRQDGRIRDLGAAIGRKKELLRRWQEELEKLLLPDWVATRRSLPLRGGGEADRVARF